MTEVIRVRTSNASDEIKKNKNKTEHKTRVYESQTRAQQALNNPIVANLKTQYLVETHFFIGCTLRIASRCKGFYGFLF